MTLPNDVIVYPGHGAGSACGKNMSKETTDTLGNQKLFNYALRAQSKRSICSGSDYRTYASSAVLPQKCGDEQTGLRQS